MFLNKTQIIGTTTRDPELKSMPGGSAVCSFSIATNRTWKDKEGNKKEDVEFHNLVSFGKTAEIISQYVKKGQLIYVEGRLKTRSWDDAGGKKMYRTEIIVENFQFGPKAQGVQKDEVEETEKGTEESEVINSDDIPF